MTFEDEAQATRGGLGAPAAVFANANAHRNAGTHAAPRPLPRPARLPKGAHLYCDPDEMFTVPELIGMLARERKPIKPRVSDVFVCLPGIKATTWTWNPCCYHLFNLMDIFYDESDNIGKVARCADLMFKDLAENGYSVMGYDRDDYWSDPKGLFGYGWDGRKTDKDVLKQRHVYALVRKFLFSRDRGAELQRVHGQFDALYGKLTHAGDREMLRIPRPPPAAGSEDERFAADCYEYVRRTVLVRVAERVLSRPLFGLGPRRRKAVDYVKEFMAPLATSLGKWSGASPPKNAAPRR